MLVLRGIALLGGVAAFVGAWWIATHREEMSRFVAAEARQNLVFGRQRAEEHASRMTPEFMWAYVLGVTALGVVLVAIAVTDGFKH